MEIEFARNIIQVLDSSTNVRLNSRKFKGVDFDEVSRNSFKSFNAKSESGRNFLVSVDFVREHHVLDTGGEYILDICLDTPYHGFYFGLYEIGEFEIDEKSLNLRLIRSFPIKYVGSGVSVINENEKTLYFGLRISEGDNVTGPHRYYIVKLDWNSFENNWRLEVPAPVMAIHIEDNLLFCP